ncbi:MAG: hypothetical protein RsTaC01_0350 [Candidatus Paraimprobicoccus trichonymphae]|uniref:Uncharacterized protein n=1 Tax=Candidatus Paraimprobicoccus trichonymphae TaxID=3033793 RepID=A0AA48I9G5_9FIRM|nr:MAG: hypothetical protein RsTaC01_0350 [Candidatus Paraimprobicoccus trichonymphae]
MIRYDKLLSLLKFFLLMVILTFSIFIFAEENENYGNFEDNSEISSQENNSQEDNLNEEKTNKILEELGKLKCVEDSIAKLDKIIIKAEVLKNEKLKEYAIKKKEILESQRDLEIKEKQLESMKISDESLKKIQESEEKEDFDLESLENVISENTMNIIKDLEDKNLEKISESLLKIEKILNTSDLNPKLAYIVNVILLYELKTKIYTIDCPINLIEDLDSTINNLKSFERYKYSDELYDHLSNYSEKFYYYYKQSNLIYPEQIIFLDNKYTNYILNDPPIKYNDIILISAKDVGNLFKYEVSIEKDETVIALKSSENKLEFVIGEKIAYFDDKIKNISIETINLSRKEEIDGIYIPLRTLVDYNKADFIYLPEYSLYIIV